MTADHLYQVTEARPGDFRFDDKVADVFSDMISRSVPGYHLALQLTGLVAREFLGRNARCYDLGCALGASSVALRNSLPDDTCEIIAIDDSPAMIKRCAEVIDNPPGVARIRPVLGDVLTCPIEAADMVVLNYTLQFLPYEVRHPFLTRIASGMTDRGMLLLSEKVEFEDEAEDRLAARLHHAFKRGMGYSQLEIDRKQEAIRDVLRRDRISAHVDRLRSAGFARVYRCLQNFQFVTFLAFRSDG